MSDQQEVERAGLTAPVDEVTLLEDRALVSRRGSITLEAGRRRLRVDAVAPVVVDKTLVVVVEEPAGSARVLDALVRRRLVVRSTDPLEAAAESDVAGLEARRDELDRELAGLEAKAAVLAGHADGLRSVATQSFRDLNVDAAWGRAIGEEWAARLDRLRGSEHELRERMVDLGYDINRLRKHRSRLSHRITALHNPAETESAVIAIDMLVEAPGDYTIRIDYVVPGACWRPYHTAQLVAGDSPHVVVSTDACVWQNTGEDWTDAQLCFSTERASLGTKPPELSNDVLSWKRKAETVQVESRDQVIETTGFGASPSTISPELPGIDDAGDVINLRAPARSTVPTDGRPHRIQLSTFQADADVELVAMPELNACVLTKTSQANTASAPILAGPVDLIRDSGFVGRTRILYIAAGEKFEIGWGPDPELRVKRDIEVTDQKSRMLSSWLTRGYQVTVRLSNLGDSARSVRVTERVPVSEIDKVKIKLDPQAVTGGRTPDENGFVTWDVRLEPFGHETLDLAYKLEKHEDVVGI